MWWGKGGGETGCVHRDREERGVLYHIAGEPGQRWKHLSRKAADLGGNGCFICTGVRLRTGRVEGGEKAESLP